MYLFSLTRVQIEGRFADAKDTPLLSFSVT